MDVKLRDVTTLIDKRKREVMLDVEDVAQMINSAYDYDEFGDLNIDTVTRWIQSMYPDTKFTMSQAHELVDIARNNGYRF